MVQAAAETFLKSSNNIPKKSIDKTGIEHNAWIVPPLVCAMQYNNDARYLPEDATFEAEVQNKPMEDNVRYLRGRSPLSSNHFSSFSFLRFKHNVTSLSARGCYCIT